MTLEDKWKIDDELMNEILKKEKKEKSDLSKNKN